VGVSCAGLTRDWRPRDGGHHGGGCARSHLVSVELCLCDEWALFGRHFRKNSKLFISVSKLKRSDSY
jgi:hypothetical protein